MPGRGCVSVDVFVYVLVRVHVLDVFLISNDFVVSAMKTIFQFHKCQGDTVFGARRCAHDRRNFCDKEPPSRAHRLPERVRHSRKKIKKFRKKRPYGCTLEAPDVAVSAQCVVEREAVVSDMMDIVICVDHSCVFWNFLVFSSSQCVVLGFLVFGF